MTQSPSSIERIAVCSTLAFHILLLLWRLSCFDSALEIINHPSYPPARKASDKRRIDEAVRSIIDLEEQARIAIKQQRGRSAQTIKSLTPPYTGYWVKPIAFRLPFLWLVIFLFLTLIS